MRLLDTNVIVYALDKNSPLQRWAESQIADAVTGGGAAVNAVSLAELCASTRDADAVAGALLTMKIQIVDVPASASEACGVAYREYVRRRKLESGKDAPRMPLPDFFIGAHALVEGWAVVTNDSDRFKAYFPDVQRIEPPL